VLMPGDDEAVCAHHLCTMVIIIRGGEGGWFTKEKYPSAPRIRYARNISVFRNPRMPKPIPHACEARRMVTCIKSKVYLERHLKR
jgi:hypothetical protein